MLSRIMHVSKATSVARPGCPAPRTGRRLRVM